MESAENIKAVERMQAFIEANLHQPITLHMLAGAAGYSPWHAAKLARVREIPSVIGALKRARIALIPAA